MHNTGFPIEHYKDNNNKKNATIFSNAFIVKYPSEWMHLSKPAFDKCSNCNFAAFLSNNANKLHNSENKYSYYTTITMPHNLVPDVRSQNILECPGSKFLWVFKGTDRPDYSRSTWKWYARIGLGYVISRYGIMERLDQGHIFPKQEVPILSRPGIEPGPPW